MGSNPDTPPDSADPTGICPRCGRLSNFTLRGVIPLIQDANLGQRIVERVAVVICMGCGDGTAVLEELWIGGVAAKDGGSAGAEEFRGTSWWPIAAIAGITDAVPRPIRECFEEGLRCLGAHAHRGAAVMFRRTLEAIVRDRGSEVAVTALKVDLATALKVMADEHALTPDLATWAKELRLAGNAGGHFDPLNDVTPEEAADLSRLLRQVLIYLYEIAAQIKRARGPVPGA